MEKPNKRALHVKEKKPTKRCRKRDLFRNLPEAMVSEILFRLPTKDAVRTSILSKSWKRRWTYSPKVFIDKLPWQGQQNKTSFIKAINKILRCSNNLQSFHLRSSYFDNQRSFRSWISRVLTHKTLERFQVSVCSRGIVYPSCLLNSTSLRKLWIRNIDATLCVSGFNCAPCLTSIDLFEVNIVNDDPNSSTVKFDFPVLENIKLIHVKWVNLKSVEICAPSLTTFVSGLNDDSSDWDHGFLIKLVSPRLTSFACTYGVAEVFITNGSSVESACLQYIDCENEDLEQRQTAALRVNKLANSFTSLKELDLSCFAAEALLLGRGFNGNKVTTLRLFLLSSAEQLLALLHAMPSLKFLMVNVMELEDYDYEATESLPSCIVSQLEEVVLRYFDGEVRQYHLARFLSKSANQLKKLTLVTDDLSTELISRISPILSTFTRRSPMLEIDVQPEVGQSDLGSFKIFV